MYDYDRTRTASTTDSMIRLIVDRLERERSADTLIKAYIEEAREDWEDAHGLADIGGNLSDYNRWIHDNLGILTNPGEIERKFMDLYVQAFRKFDRSMSRDSALEVMSYPDNMPDVIPARALVLLANRMAEQDARTGIALRELALKQR